MMSLWDQSDTVLLYHRLLRDKQENMFFLHPSTPKSCSAEASAMATLMVSSISASDVLPCIFSICRVINDVSLSQIWLWSVAAAGEEVTVRAAPLQPITKAQSSLRALTCRFFSHFQSSWVGFCFSPKHFFPYLLLSCLTVNSIS